MFFLGLHDVGQGDIAWFIQAQVCGDDSGQGDRQYFQTAIDLARDLSFAVHHFDFGCEGSLRQVSQCSQHLTRLVAIVVNGLFAQDDQARLFFVNQGFEQFGHRQWLQFFCGFNQDGAVGADGHGGAQCFLTLRYAARNSDHFSGKALLFQSNCFFHSNLIEGVHAHFDVGDIDARAVRFDAHLHVVINNPLHGHKNFHCQISKKKTGSLIIDSNVYAESLCLVDVNVNVNCA